VLPTPAAHATPLGVATARITLGMHLVGFDAATARAHGYVVTTLPDGSTASVPAARAADAHAGAYRPAAGVLANTSGKTGNTVSPDGYGLKQGDCGDSWVELDAIGDARARLLTGMDLVVDSGGPWDVHWHVSIHDNGGSSTQNYGEQDGFLGAFSWTAYARGLGLTRGTAIAGVTSGSFTITGAGWICFSYSPTTAANIY
jgi:hypothetical protein